MKTKSKIIIISIILLMPLQAMAQKKIIFPRAFAFAVDDLGWNIGYNAGHVDSQGPYRIGIDRKMDIKNYKCIFDVAKKVGVRIQTLFVMSEMDRLNILSKHPTTTWQGKDWDNSKNVCQEQVGIMNFVKENAAYIEFGLHGVGHEFWVEGEQKRAEWYCTQDDHPWPEITMKEHIQCFKDIMAQYELTEENGQSFPESFVPCAYGFYWNPDGQYSTGKIMSEAGVKYVNTLFDYIRELNPPKDANGGGFDNGVHVINRINYGNEWWKMNALPNIPLEQQETDIIESHWSNWLAQDDFIQSETNNRWIDYYRMVQKSEERYIAKNTEQLHSQWLYNKYTTITEENAGTVFIDNTKMPDNAYENNILGNMVLKIELKNGEHISNASIGNNLISAYFEESGYGFIYLPVLNQQTDTLTYFVSKKRMPFLIYNDGTYNVYNVVKDKNNYQIEIKMYGTQIVKIECKEPKDVISDNKHLKILERKYDQSNMVLSLKVKGRDMQGERGKIILSY